MPPMHVRYSLMPISHLSRLDLNLLVALDALLEERSVTRAAARLGSSCSNGVCISIWQRAGKQSPAAKLITWPG